METETMVQVVYNDEDMRRCMATTYLYARDHGKAWDIVRDSFTGKEIVDVYITSNPLYFTRKGN